MNKPFSSHFWDGLASLKLTIVCLAALMVLVIGCTLAQVSLGTWGAVELYMRRFLVWWDLPGTHLSVPVFPGGALVGLVLMFNLVVAQVRRIELSWKKAGLWIVHAGLILLFVGEFITGVYQVDTRLAVEVGQTVDFVESPRENELALTDVTDPAHDDVYGVSERLLARGGQVAIPGTPVTLTVKRFFHNAQLATRRPSDPPAQATAGVGTGITVSELPPATGDDEVNRTTALIEPVAGGRSYGTWLVSNVLGAPQAFTHEGRTYKLELRPRRWYLPYSVTLKQFRHDVYAGTDIPKNFSSLVQLKDPARNEDREVLIYMNQPLRYDGKAFYQASFGKGDTLSVLQVVENPGWLLPYIACILVGLGLIVHFAIGLRRMVNRRRVAALEATT
ncbi:MAG TPA: cytochrome c biogenesis protein ResB [Anaeromyxobacteraceae bacterium]|nr:cytochrome c biogenesis protein ResB [Anaeromyxobacteraceae bacterium]